MLADDGSARDNERGRARGGGQSSDDSARELHGFGVMEGVDRKSEEMSLVCVGVARVSGRERERWRENRKRGAVDR